MEAQQFMAICNACALTLLLAIFVTGCAQRHPITVEAVEPWQRSYEQSAEQQSYLSPPPAAAPNEPSAEALTSSQLPQPMAFVSDVIAFPFRGLGWLVQVVF